MTVEIHRLESLWLAASILLIVAFISTVAYGAVGPGVQMVDDSGGTVDAAAVRSGDHPQFGDPGVRATGPDRYAVYVVARQFAFEPGTVEPIRLPAGSTVTFYLTSADVIHGFQVVGTNVNVMAIPGQVSRFTVVFEAPGRYGLVCNEYCGAAHHTMEGQLLVVPADRFEGAS